VLFTADGGVHWRQYSLPHFVNWCQAFQGDLLCRAAMNGHIGVVTLHPK
jgi:hypothetical protein